MVPLDSPCSHESSDIKFVPKKCFYGAKIHFTKCGLFFWSTMYQTLGQAFQFFHIWILLIFLRSYMVVGNQHLSTKISLSQYVLQISFLIFGHLFRCQVPVLSIPCSYLLFLVIFTILFDRIWWRTELVAYILLLPNQHHVMWSFKFPTVQSANTSLLSHLPPPQMHLFTWFFLLWPLATLYYHLGLSNSLLHHWGHHKSSNTAVSLTTLPYYHC